MQKKDFAAKIGIAPQQLTRYKNQQMPSVEILVRMAIALNVSTDYLLGLNKSVNPWQARAEAAEKKLEVLKTVYTHVSAANSELSKII